MYYIIETDVMLKLDNPASIMYISLYCTSCPFPSLVNYLKFAIAGECVCLRHCSMRRSKLHTQNGICVTVPASH